MRRLVGLGLMILSIVQPLKAGREGSGGDVLVCFEDPSKSFAENEAEKRRVEEILLRNKEKAAHDDAFEAVNFENLRVEKIDLFLNKSRGLFDRKTWKLITSSSSAEEIAEERLSLLEEKTSFGNELRQVFDGELNESRWYPSSNGVVEIDDAGIQKNFPSNCLVVQLGYRDETGVYFDDRLFDRLTELGKAAFYLHEGIYVIARKLEHENSVHVREMVGLMFSTEFEEMTSSELMGRMSRMNLMGTYPRTFSFYTKIKIADEDLNLILNPSFMDLVYTYEDLGLFSMDYSSLRADGPLPSFSFVPFPGDRSLWENVKNRKLRFGHLARSAHVQGLALKGGPHYSLAFWDNDSLAIGVISEFHRFGAVDAEAGSKFVLDEQGQPLVLEGKLHWNDTWNSLSFSKLIFDGEGELQNGRLTQAAIFKGPFGELPMPKGGLVRFHPRGSISSILVSSEDPETIHSLNYQGLALAVGIVDLYPDGSLQSSRLAQNEVQGVWLNSGDQSTFTSVEFHQNGKLKHAQLSRNKRQRLRTVSGRTTTCGGSWELLEATWNEEGLLLSCGDKHFD